MVLSIANDGKPKELQVYDCKPNSLSAYVDVIDICRLRSDIYPFAAVSLAIDNSLHFSNDLFHKGVQRTFAFQEISGTPYRLLSANGDIYILTNTMLYILP